FGAITALKLNASTQSREILEEARQKNSFRERTIQNALEYIDRHPAPLADEDLTALSNRLGEALSIGKFEGVKATRVTPAGDKALVDLYFRSGIDALTYTATVHRLDGVWTVRGVRETMQAMMSMPLVTAPAKPK